MLKKEMQKLLRDRGVKFSKSWTKAQLEGELSLSKHILTHTIKTENVSPSGNWNVAKDWFPIIEVSQDDKKISITTHRTSGHQKKASVETELIAVDSSEDGTQVFVRGEVSCRNWQNYKCSGQQKFCYAIFEGDSGHIYTHRAAATKGWMTADPGTIRKRLRKLGIGATNVIQQGDFLLKPANRKGFKDEEFKHERMGSGHHNFETPVLFHRGQYMVTESTTLIHTAVDGIQHPDVIVPPGKYIVGTTANQLNHSNARD